MQDDEGRRGRDLGRGQPGRRRSASTARWRSRVGASTPTPTNGSPSAAATGRRSRRWTPAARRGSRGALWRTSARRWPRPRAPPKTTFTSSSAADGDTHPADATPWSSWRRESWIKDHDAAATRYVEMMLDMIASGRTRPRLGRRGKENLSRSGPDDQELEAAWQLFRDGGYFSVNGGINYAATQKVMDLFFKLRSESPNQYRRSRPTPTTPPAQGGA